MGLFWRFVPMLLCLAWLSGPAQAGWKVAETANFRLYSQAPEADLVQQAALLEDFRALLVLATGHVPNRDLPRLDVFIVRDLADAMPWRDVSKSAAGFYRANAGRISAFALERSRVRQGDVTSQHVLLHEYAHHFMLAANGPAYPAWYVEGFAEYFSTAEFTPEQIMIGKFSTNRALWLSNADWQPLDTILSGEANARNAPMFYAQSWLLTHYLFRVPDMRDRLIAYLTDYARGANPVDAFREHVHPDLRSFNSRMQRYKNGRSSYSIVERSVATAASVTVRALPPSSDLFLLRLAALEHGVSEKSADVALADIRSVANDRSDPLAMRTLALAELELGDPAVAAALLDSLLEKTPDDPDLLRWRAQAMRPMGRDASPETLSEARRLLVRAFRSDPRDWRTMHAYVRLHSPSTRPLPADVLDVLLRTHELAPQVSEVVLDTAVALAHANRMAEAEKTLQPLAYSPHSGKASALAARLLERVRAGDRPGFLREVTAARHRRGDDLAVLGKALDHGR